MTNPNTAPSAAQPTKESPSPNYRPCKDAAPADYPPPVSKEQLLQDLGYFSPSSARLRDAPEWQRHDRLRRFIEQSGRSGVSADPLPRPLLTDLEIQGLRRQARNDPRCADQHWFILMVRAIESYYGVTGAAAQSQPLVEPTAAVRDVLTERQRQIEREGWTPAHDDEHSNGAMATAAACYALTHIQAPLCVNTLNLHALWQWTGWAAHWFKPKTHRQDLIRAGALIVAEIERLDRASPQHQVKKGEPS